jgi:uncharacterized protein with PIN domain
MIRDYKLRCPKCKTEINILSEEYFQDEYLKDDESHWIECQKCWHQFYIQTILNPIFIVDDNIE